MSDVARSPEGSERNDVSVRNQEIPSMTVAGGTTSDPTAGEAATVLPDPNTTGSGKKEDQTSNQTLAAAGETLDYGLAKVHLDYGLAKVHRIIVERRIDTGSGMPDEQET